jgi:tetratricopeptide (TPR) repeat protein
MKVKDGARKRSSAARIEHALLEKYCHSLAALLHEEGHFARAVRFFKRSLRLDDRPAVRADLALTYLDKGDPERALGEIDRAIARAPGVAEYFSRRSAVWRAKGEEAKAREDEQAAIRCDRNYGRAAAIRASAAALQRFFLDDPFRLPDAAGIEDPRLAALAAKGDGPLSNPDLRERSCIVPCPAYCCHFGHEPIVHGVWIGAWKLSALRAFLKEKGCRERAFIAAFPVRLKGYLARLIPPHVVMRRGKQDCVFYPARAAARLGKRQMREAPKGIDYKDVTWFTADARACAFLKDRRCTMYDVGGEALPSCKDFFCLTGFVFLVLEHLGIASAGELEGKSMALLNGVAVEALLLLSDRICNDGTPLSALRAAMGQTLAAGVDADAAGAGRKEIDTIIDRYRRQKEDYGQRFSAERKFIAEQVRALIAGQGQRGRI